MLDPKIFRAYDIRGIADDDFNDAAVTALGHAFGAMVKERGGHAISVGHDCRLSGPRIYEAFCNGILQADVNVSGLGTVATPLTYFSEHHLDTDASVSITGSHNPANWNGFKFTIDKGALFGDDIQEIRKRAALYAPAHSRGKFESINIEDAYIEYALSTLRPLTEDVSFV